VGAGLNRRYLVEMDVGAGLDERQVEQAHREGQMPGVLHAYDSRSGRAAFSFEPW
jgi:hypothetical protein